MAAAGLDFTRACSGRSGRGADLSRQIQPRGAPNPSGLACAAALSARPLAVLRVSRWPTAAFPSSSPRGGRSLTTTCATDCSCSRRSPRRLRLLVYLSGALPSVGRRDCASRACWPACIGRRELRLNLARHADLPAGSPDQHAHPQSTRSSTRDLARKVAARFHSAHVPRRPRWRRAEGRNSARARHQRRQSPHLEAAADPDGLWEHALADPSRYADYVVAFEGDVVWQAVHGRHLPELVEIHVTGQARAILYRAR